MTDLREKIRRRRLIRAWIPATILVILSVAALTVALTVRSTGVGEAPTSAPSDAVTAQGTSLFTVEGLDYINDSRRVFIDATTQPIAAEPLGLAATGTITIVPPTAEASEYLSAVGDGGGMRLPGNSITVTSRDGSLVSASVSDSRMVLSYRDARVFLRDRAEKYNIPAADADAFRAIAAAAIAAGTGYSHSIKTDAALGFTLTTTVTCNAQSSCFAVDEFDFE